MLFDSSIFKLMLRGYCNYVDFGRFLEVLLCIFAHIIVMPFALHPLADVLIFASPALQACALYETSDQYPSDVIIVIGSFSGNPPRYESATWCYHGFRLINSKSSILVVPRKCNRALAPRDVSSVLLWQL